MERRWHGHDIHRANTIQIGTASTVVSGTLPEATDSDLSNCSPYKTLLRVRPVNHFTDEKSVGRFSKLSKLTCKLN